MSVWEEERWLLGAGVRINSSHPEVAGRKPRAFHVAKSLRRGGRMLRSKEPPGTRKLMQSFARSERELGLLYEVKSRRAFET